MFVILSVIFSNAYFASYLLWKKDKVALNSLVLFGWVALLIVIAYILSETSGTAWVVAVVILYCVGAIIVSIGHLVWGSTKAASTGGAAKKWARESWENLFETEIAIESLLKKHIGELSSITLQPAYDTWGAKVQSEFMKLRGVMQAESLKLDAATQRNLIDEIDGALDWIQGGGAPASTNVPAGAGVAAGLDFDTWIEAYATGGAAPWAGLNNAQHQEVITELKEGFAVLDAEIKKINRKIKGK
ncbi:hypothetical protein ACFLZN_01755 [Nanoarchaeota archaeon]